MNGVFKSQVTTVLKKVRQVDDSKRITLLSFVPFYWIFTRRKKILYLKSELAKDGIQLKVVPAFIRNKWMGKKYFITFLLWVSAPIAVYFVYMKRIDIIHARSYPAALIGLIAKKLLRRMLLFDMRGIYPEEGILAGYWREESVPFKRWKRFEKILVEQADSVVVVSEVFAEHIRSIANEAKVTVIPCCVDMKTFSYRHKYRLQWRDEYNLNSKFVVIYSGSFQRWTGERMLAKICKSIKMVKSNAFFLIATIDDISFLQRCFTENKLTKDDYLITNVQWFDIPKLLAIGDIGILPRKYSIVNQVSCPVKFVEYMASALPTIVSRNTSNIANFVEMHKVGAVIDFGDSNETKRILQHFFNSYKKMRLNCLKLAESYYAIDRVVHQYTQLYAKLNNKWELL